MKFKLRLLVALTFITGFLFVYQNCGKSELIFSERSFSSEEGPGLGEAEIFQASEIRPRMLDRYAIRSILLDIFGPSVTEIVRFNLFYRIASFGRPCDKNDIFIASGNPPQVENLDTICVNSDDTMVPMVGLSDVVREGYRIQTCQLIAGTPAAATFAMTKVFGSNQPTIPQSSGEQDRQRVSAAFMLFFPFQTPSAEVVDDLIELANTPGDDGSPPATPREAWNLIFLTLCLSPEWQVL